MTLWIITKGANRYQKVGSEWGGARNFGVYQTIAPKNLLLKVIFALNRGFLPWIFGAGLKSGSAYALVDLVSLAPLSILNLESNQHSQFRTKISFHPLYVLSFAPAETLSPFPEIYETIKKSALASPQNAELMLVPRDWKTSQTTYYIHHVVWNGRAYH